MKHGSLFSGIGGFDLAAEWMGWNNVLQCEYDDFCQKILKYYWPYATQFKDIKTTDFTAWNGYIDILTGGFPCQPFSVAGKRQGTEDDRHLWPEMLRAISEIEPQWVVGENVGGIVNWNKGLVFEQVQADLEAKGYEVQAFILPAAGVNAPQRRDRTWFVAYSQKLGRDVRFIKKKKSKGEIGRCDCQRFSANSNECRLERWQTEPNKKLSINRDYWGEFPTEHPICGRNDGLPTELDGITFSKWRKESIKGYGNAIVPQVAFQIFKAIEKMNNTF